MKKSRYKEEQIIQAALDLSNVTWILEKSYGL
jgi:hypothetical protein